MAVHEKGWEGVWKKRRGKKLTIAQDKDGRRHGHDDIAGNTQILSKLGCCWGNHRWRDGAYECERRDNKGSSPFLAVRPAARMLYVKFEQRKREVLQATYFWGFMGSSGPSQSTQYTESLLSGVSSLTFTVLDLSSDECSRTAAVSEVDDLTGRLVVEPVLDIMNGVDEQVLSTWVLTLRAHLYASVDQPVMTKNPLFFLINNRIFIEAAADNRDVPISAEARWFARFCWSWYKSC